MTTQSSHLDHLAWADICTQNPQYYIGLQNSDSKFTHWFHQKKQHWIHWMPWSISYVSAMHIHIHTRLCMLNHSTYHNIYVYIYTYHKLHCWSLLCWWAKGCSLSSPCLISLATGLEYRNFSGSNNQWDDLTAAVDFPCEEPAFNKLLAVTTSLAID